MDALDLRRKTYTRHRDARVALIRCCECNEYYETSVRQARRIRKGESRRLCQLCRNLEEALQSTPEQTYKHVMWWLEESGLSRVDLRAIASMMFAEPEARPVEPVTSPLGRLSSEEGNRTNNGHWPATSILISGVSLAISSSNAA